MSKKTVKDEMVIMLQRKNKEMEGTIGKLKNEADEVKRGDGAAEQKIRVLNEMHSQKTKALLMSITKLKKEIAKIQYGQKDNVRHQKNVRLEEDLKMMDIAINALRKQVGDEDKCNVAIKRELEKGPQRVRVLSREELKIEIKKYKNMSLKIIKEFQRTGGKVPAYAQKLAKEDAEGGNSQVGLKKEKSESNLEDFEGESMFENSEAGAGEDIPEKVQDKIDKLEDQVVKLNLDLKDKNESILDLLQELEEVKIQVYARDKSVDLQQKQIEELLEELRESKGLENDVKILVQKKMALSDENEKLRDELNRNLMNGDQAGDETNELIMINSGLNAQIKKLQQQIQDEKKIRQVEQARLKAELKCTHEKHEHQNREFMTKENEVSQAKAEAFKIQEDLEAQNKRELKDLQAKLEREKQNEIQSKIEANQRLLEGEQNKRGDMEAQLKRAHEQEIAQHRAEISKLASEKESMADDHGKKLQEHEEQIENVKKTAVSRQSSAQDAGMMIKGRGAAGSSGAKDHTERRKKAAERRALIEAQEEADALGESRKLRDELDRKEKLRSLSQKRSRSRAGKSNKDGGEASLGATPVKLTNLNRDRPSTAIQRGRAPVQPAESPEAPPRRPTTAASGTSKDRQLYAIRQQRELQQQLLDMEEEKAENEALAQQKAQLERAQQFAQKRKNRQGSVSQSPTKQAKEPEEVDFNESLGKSAKSIRFGEVPLDDVLEESAGN